MTTNGGRRVFIQTTFDVTSVCKPLVSTSALERQGVTIVFNHGYDRIIVRSDTVNFVSHDCHSSLLFRLAGGTPLRKAMVLTGESVSDDVDEEVYEREGDETSVAKGSF